VQHLVRRELVTSSCPPTDLPCDPFDLLDERIIRPLGSDLFAGGCSPAKDLLDASIAAPESAGEQHAILFRWGVLEDHPKFLVRPRFALVAFIEACRLLQLDETLLHYGNLIVKGHVPDLFLEQSADSFPVFSLVHPITSVCAAELVSRATDSVPDAGPCSLCP
jgi:hypothetical protein